MSASRLKQPFETVFSKRPGKWSVTNHWRKPLPDPPFQVKCFSRRGGHVSTTSVFDVQDGKQLARHQSAREGLAYIVFEAGKKIVGAFVEGKSVELPDENQMEIAI